MSKDFKVDIRKVTDEALMREACEMTFLGKSKITLHKMYACEHSPCRTQMFWVRLYNIPLFCSTQLLRHHIGSQPFQLSCRPDRKGGYNHFQAKLCEVISLMELGHTKEATAILDWLGDNADRYTPVNLGLLLNAQSLINIAKERLCSDASPETHEIFNHIKAEITKVDPDLAPFLVPRCLYRGGICNSLKPCGFNKTELFQKQLNEYKKLFL